MGRRRQPIYVETRIRAPMEELWAATQEPDRHQRWDVRFGRIEYLPKIGDEPQQFTYATTVAPGVTIAGTGESLGDKDRPDGSRWSGLKFWAQDRRSLIEAGAGYWRYLPTDDGIRFLTRYDYRPRWGAAGRLIDRTVFRPLFGWATAWSFDRLRLWLEDRVPPEQARNQAVAHATAVAGLAGVWIYQGVVPKLWKTDPAEVGYWRKGLRLNERNARKAVHIAGAAEVAFGVATVAFSRRRGLFAGTALAMPVLVTASAVIDRKQLARAFNPVSLNWSVAGLAAIAYVTTEGLPSGRRTLRRAPDTQPPVDEVP